jgi:PAS domain-containing protein
MSSEQVAASQVKRITGYAQATRIERREWVLWFLALLVTLLLTVAVVSFALPAFNPPWDSFYWFHIGQSIHGLIAMVLLFDVYAIYQQLQIQRIRRQLNERDELFRVITENAADMIAVVETDGKRIYNSPAYERVLGYSLEELGRTSAFEQIHPDDRQQVIDAADRAWNTGCGTRMVPGKYSSQLPA